MRTICPILLLMVLLAPAIAMAQVYAPVPLYPSPAAPSAPAAPAAPALPALPAPSPVPVPAPPAPVEGQPAPVPPLPPIDQVQIQVWISETNENGLRDVGGNLQYSRVTNGVAQSGSLEQIRTQTINPLSPNYTVTMPAPDTSQFPKPPASHAPQQLRPDQNNNAADNTQTQTGAGLVFSIVKSSYGTLDGVLRGIEQKADGDLISKPELLVVNNGIAEIHAGEQVPFQNIAYNILGASQLAVTWQDVGVNLKLQPLIVGGTIQLTLTQLAVSDRVLTQDVRGVDMPVFATRSQTGVVLVPDGQTLVIGGLSSRTVTRAESRVPILGAVPIAGVLFRSRTSKASNSHLLIFVSPMIVNLRNMSEDAHNALNFWQDRKWENSERISKEIQVMQDEL